MNTSHATGPSDPSSDDLAAGELAVAWDVAGMIRRVRRTADLSQRDLAALLGVAPATIARWETGHTEPTVTMLRTILALAGYRLQVIDTATDQPVPSMRGDGIRDDAGRRHPAHLDVVIHEFETTWRYDRPRHTREAPRRRRRDRIRDEHAAGKRWSRTCCSWVNAPEHPNPVQVADQHQRWYEQRRQRNLEAIRRTSFYQQSLNQPDCYCLLACHENGPCVPECDCACEPATVRDPWQSG